MGRVWKFGDGISTDQITPGTKNLEGGLGGVCFFYERPEYREQVRAGDYVLGGKNFGCGSSRETAPRAIKESGAAAVLALGYARIFRENAANQGLLVIVVGEDAYDSISDGDEIDVNLETGTIETNGRGTFMGQLPDPDSMAIIEAGGLLPYLRERGWRYDGEVVADV